VLLATHFRQQRGLWVTNTKATTLLRCSACRIQTKYVTNNWYEKKTTAGTVSTREKHESNTRDSKYRLLTLNIRSLARQRCLPSWGPRRTPCFFCNFSTVWYGRLHKLCFLGFWNYNSVIQALLASNILCLFISTEVTGGTELLHTHSSLIQNLNNVIFWALSAGHFSNLQSSQPKNNKNNNIPHL